MSDINFNDFESECISKIWDYYYKEIADHEHEEIPISLSLIKLMEVLKRTKNKALITKALLLTISFFPRCST